MMLWDAIRSHGSRGRLDCAVTALDRCVDVAQTITRTRGDE